MRVMIEFVKGDYARNLCDDCNVQPLIGSPAHMRISVLFASVKLADTPGPVKLQVKLHPVFEQRSIKLLEKLVKHLRARMPELEWLEYKASSPPSTKTIII